MDELKIILEEMKRIAPEKMDDLLSYADFFDIVDFAVTYRDAVEEIGKHNARQLLIESLIEAKEEHL